MTNGYTAMAYVEMLRKAAITAANEVTALQNDQNKHAFLVQQAVARRDALQEVLSEAVKLLNAISNGEEWFIQKDGSVRVTTNKSGVMPGASQMGLLDG